MTTETQEKPARKKSDKPRITFTTKETLAFVRRAETLLLTEGGDLDEITAMLSEEFKNFHGDQNAVFKKLEQLELIDKTKAKYVLNEADINQVRDFVDSIYERCNLVGQEHSSEARALNVAIRRELASRLPKREKPEVDATEAAD